MTSATNHEPRTTEHGPRIRYRFKPALLAFLLVGSGIACQSPTDTGSPAIPNLDPTAQTRSSPELLARGFISTGLGERDASYSPDGNTFHYTLWTGRFGVILETRKVENGWSDPVVASFSGRHSDLEPFVTPDGGRLFFASNRPLEEGGDPKDYDIWFVERADTSWGEPVHVGPNVNTEANEFYPTLDNQGALYFTAAYDHSIGGEDIWMSPPAGAAFGPAVNAGPGVNTERDEFNAMIAPDGSFLAFSSFGREDGLGGGDLYVSFRDSTGQLGPGQNMGPAINSESLDFSPALTPDGRTFLFSSRRSIIQTPVDVPRTYDELRQQLGSPGNGDLDIYRVDAGFLKGLQAQGN